MARKTEYQKQADKRTKDALKLRARYDARARKYASQLRQAILDAEAAAGRIYRINELYGVDLAPRTLLTHDMAAMELSDKLFDVTQSSAPGEEIQLFNPTPDGNGGLALGAEGLFGEVGGVVGSPPVPGPTAQTAPPPTPSPLPTPTPPPTPAPSPIEVTELRAELSEGSWSLWVGTNSPSGSTLIEHPVYAGEFITCYNGRSRFIGLGARPTGEQLVVRFADAADSTITTTRTITLGA